MQILVINGPNLNLLGKREPEVYGDRGFDGYLEELRRQFPAYTIDYYQSNIEGELIDVLHDADNRYHGVVLNAGGYTHTSIALADAVKAVYLPVVEVHLTNTRSREPYRHVSYYGANCIGNISGFGLDSYRLAIVALEKVCAKS